MEVLGNLFYGLGIALSPENLLMALIGVVLGVAIGAMPGLGSVNGVAILLPLTTIQCLNQLVKKYSN